MATDTFKSEAGEDYILSPINTIGDMKELRFAAQYADYLTIKDRPEFDSELKDRVFDLCSKKRLTQTMIDEYLASPEGTLTIIQMSLSKKHPTITIADCGKLATVLNGKDIASKIQVISGFKTVSVAAVVESEKKVESPTT